MNKILNQYLLVNFFKVFINTVFIFFSLGILLNLFEEIEFFKNLDQSMHLPVMLTLSFVPTLIIELMPFIVFLSSMFYFVSIRSNKDLLSIKIFGYSNLKITLIITFFTFLMGWVLLLFITPITSTLVKFYETEKSKYSRDVDHLISVNKNGLWIKEITNNGYKIINAEKIEGQNLKKISIFIFSTENKILRRIEAESAIILDNPWKMKNAHVYEDNNGNKKVWHEEYDFYTEKVLDKINSLFRNLNTLSFFDLVKDYKYLNEIGYSKKLLNTTIHKFVALPFFISLMVVLAAIFTIGSSDARQNYYYVIISILISVIIFYFKDLSIALGQTGKINLILSIWMPVVVIGLFCSMGLIQINEK